MNLFRESFMTCSYILAFVFFPVPYYQWWTTYKMKGTDHVNIFFWNVFENPLIYGVFHSQGKRMKILKMFFFYLYLGQILSDWALVVCKHPHAIKKWGHLETPHFEGPKWWYPLKKISKFLVKYFSKVIIWKVKHILAAFKHLF